jgi:hypothetical protein
MSNKVVQQMCNSGQFKRMNYFHGMLLTEQDFVDEQTYIREKLKLHNRLHGAGAVRGLRLVKDCVQVDSIKVTKILIEAGWALDCAGNEIVVCQDYLVPLDEKIDELRRFGRLTRVGECQPPEYVGPKLFIGIRYCECKSDPAEQLTSECADDRLRPQFSRVREGFHVQIFTQEELPRCGTHGHTASQNCCSHGCSARCSDSCPDCKGLHLCADEEQIVILGTVENYDTSVGNPDHRDATITNADEHMPACRTWETQKQKLLRHVLEKAGWIDVSILIGEKKTGIGERLQKLGLTLGQIYNSGSIQDVQGFFGKVRDAEPWAAPDSVIDVVTDESDKCVVFLFVNPAVEGVTDK